MPRGTIKRLTDRGFGFIEPETGGKDVFFHARFVEGTVQYDGLCEGMDVEYEAEQDPKGLAAKMVKVLSGTQATQTRRPRPEAKSKLKTDSYRFLNPYNFVRFLVLKENTDATSDKPSGKDKLFGKCAPPPHDRLVGISGSITCKLKTLTPLFVSDPRILNKNEKGHKTYQFFELDSNPTIPGSSLRGVIRSAFEAITNSCLGVFNGEKRLEYRSIKIARNMRAGIVKSLPYDDQLGEIILCEEAKIAAYYEDNNLEDLKKFNNGDTAYAIVKNGRVFSLKNPNKDLTNISEKWIKGRLKIGGCTIDNKKNESFFFYDAENTKIATFSKDCMDDYNAVLKEQCENRAEDFKTAIQSKTLQPDNLVYTELVSDDTVRYISTVKVPRLRYRRPLKELLPSPNLKHCKSNLPFCLCPACRTFGWVAEEKNPSLNDTTAYAGRVRFSNAKVDKEGELFEENVELAILGSPKPTTTLFYLLNKYRQPSLSIDYDTQTAQLRGRKFYRFQKILSPDEYTRPTNRDNPGKDDKNRTIRNALGKNWEFTFTINFENLATLELGALLSAIELKFGKKRLVHRLGFAKPLGFGSVEIEVLKLKVLDPRKRYESLDSSGWCCVDREAFTKHCINPFETAIAKYYGVTPFNDLENIKDLRALLSDPPLMNVHYPRPPNSDAAEKISKPDPEGKQYEWFVGNKKTSLKIRGQHKSRKPLPLKIATEDSIGFPLIDKNGKEY